MTFSPASLSASRLFYFLLLGSVVLSLGFNWPIISIGLEFIPPLWLTTYRLWGGAFVGLAMHAIAGARAAFPRRDWKIVPIIGILRLGAIYVLVFYALQILPPGRSGILVWTGTLWTVPIAMIFLKERMTRMQIAGLSVGMVGLLLVVDLRTLMVAEPRIVWGYVMLMAAALSVAWTSVYIRAHKWGASALASTPWQLLAGGIPALVAALAVEGIPDIRWTWGVILIVVYQTTLASPLAVWGQLEAFRRLPAISVNLTLMATPVVGLLSSWWLVDEHLTWGVVSGLALLTAAVAANIVGDRNMRPVRPGLA
ncbi:MAG: DMT family transporter [Actinomycetia bacterium]|nr:DMT family transporter [Actinomycetes bacterium]